MLGLGAKSLDNWTKDDHVWIRDDLPNDIAIAHIMTFGLTMLHMLETRHLDVSEISESSFWELSGQSAISVETDL